MSQLHDINAARPFVVAAGDGERIWFAHESMTIKAAASSTGGEFALIETLAPVGEGPPLHVHHDEHEAFYVLEGELDVACGDERHRAPAGTFAFLPRGVAHTWRVVGAVPARFLTFVAPGGLEGFFRDGGRPAEGPGLPPSAEIDVAHLANIGLRHNTEVVGPPLE
jgi:mannose-6-phosphate isomerase-like protein (cupin superfamily)